jgi:hypothetical protein
MSFHTCLEQYTAGDLAHTMTSQGLESLEVWFLYKSQVASSCAEAKSQILLGGTVLTFTLFL